MSKFTEHTPLPWEQFEPSEYHNHGHYVTTAFGTTVCDLYVMPKDNLLSGERKKAVDFTDAAENAALIVRAINSFDELVEVLSAVSEFEIADALLRHDNHIGGVAK